MRHQRLLFLLLVLTSSCRMSPRASNNVKKDFIAQPALTIPMGTRFSVELLHPPVAPLRVGQRIQGRLTQALRASSEGNFIPTGALISGVLTKTLPQESFQIHFESLTYSGTTMRLRAKAVPVQEPEKASWGLLELELEEPLPLQPAMKG